MMLRRGTGVRTPPDSAARPALKAWGGEGVKQPRRQAKPI